jgi:hypothetical protein
MPTTVSNDVQQLKAEEQALTAALEALERAARVTGSDGARERWLFIASDLRGGLGAIREELREAGS